MPAGHPHAAGRTARRCSSKRARPTRRRSPRRFDAIEAALAALPHVRAGALLDRSQPSARALERAQGHVPVGRRDAQDRHDRHHRGRRLSGRAPRRGHARPAAAARRSMATPTRSSSATRSKATCTSCSRRISTSRPRSSATAASWTRCAEWSSTTYDGSLKAEHGTGRNIAPFVELEWGARSVRD